MENAATEKLHNYVTQFLHSVIIEEGRIEFSKTIASDLLLPCSEADAALIEKYFQHNSKSKISQQCLMYLRRPYSKTLSSMLYRWYAQAVPPKELSHHLVPVNFQSLIVEPDLKQLTPRLVPAIANVLNAESFDISVMEELFGKVLSVPVIQLLVGMRLTIGTQSDHLPPPVHVLFDAFNKTHIKGSNPKTLKNCKLTVGAKALAKHCHRSSEQFWGDCDGSEQVKNEKAFLKLVHLLKHFVWINIHVLPTESQQKLSIMEIRVLQGYGMRFAATGDDFRGFLEPHIEGVGHDTKWRH